MPAVSQQQQKLFGLALAVKRGEVARSEASDEVLNIVDSMSEKEIEDFASTSHGGLPKQVEARLRETLRELMREMAIQETELPAAPIPSGIKTKLMQAIDKIKDTNLNYNQKLQVIGKVVDSLGIDKKELSKMSSKLKTTLESINEEDPCWKGYQQIGMKKKNGKEVPNCVPESVNESNTKKDIEKLTSYKDLFKFFKDNKSKLNKKYVNYIEDEVGALKYLESDYKRGDVDREEVLIAIEEIQDLIKKSLDINEAVPTQTKWAVAIASLTGTRADAAQKFIDDNNLNSEKLYSHLKKGKLSDRMDFMTAVAGKPGNPIQKKMIKMFGESINESHFKIGDSVTCIKSGMSGEVIGLDKEHGGEDEKYYKVKREDGKVVKYSPNELKLNESLTESSYNLGNQEYTNRKLTPTQILDLAMAYANVPGKGNPMYNNKMEKMIKVANDLAKLTGTKQMNPKARASEPALILFLLKNKLVTQDEYVKLYKNLSQKHIAVANALKNADPASRMIGGAAARQAHKDMRGEFEESVKEGKKRFNQKNNVGSSKYVISYHDGQKKHKDGSDFFDIQIFKNQKDLETFKKALLSKGFIEESVVNEAVSKTYKLPTQRGTLHIEVEEDPAGVFVDVIFNKVDLTTTDIQFPTGEIKITQRQKRVKLKESVNELKKLPNGNFSIKKGYNTFADYEKNAKPGETILKYDKRGGMIKTFVSGSELHQNAKKYLSKVHSIVGDKVNLSLFGKQGYATVPDYEKKEVGVLVLESNCGCGCSGTTIGGCNTSIAEDFKAVVGKTVFSDGKGKVHFGYYKEDNSAYFVDYKTWANLGMKDVSKGDTNKNKVLAAILKNQKQFNKKVEYNMWHKKNNPSFEQSMDYFMKNGFVGNINKGGIKVD
jgi:hypothetical protein